MKWNIGIVLFVLLLLINVSSGAGDHWPHLRFLSVTDVEGIGGNKVRLSVSAIGESSGNIALSVNGPGVLSASIEGGASRDIVEDQSYKFNAIVTLRDTPSTSEYTNYVYSRPIGSGKETFKTFTSTNIQSNNLDEYQIRIILKCKNVESIVLAPIYVDYNNIGYGNDVAVVKKGIHYIYSENTTGWYSDFTIDNPLKINIDEDQKITIEFNVTSTTDELEKKVIQEPLLTHENPEASRNIKMFIIVLGALGFLILVSIIGVVLMSIHR